MLPRVVVHNMISVDGRIDGFPADVGLYYELVSTWNVDAHLAGSDTLLTEPAPPEDETAFEPPVRDPDDRRALLVVPDSRGRLRHWHALRGLGYWRDVVALCSGATPEEYLQYLRERHIDYIVAGDDHVDLKAALEELNARYGVARIHVDSGGTLNGVLLRAGLVDEVSVLISPYLVGGLTPRSIFRAPDVASPDDAIALRLVHMEQVRDDVVWLRYEVVR